MTDLKINEALEKVLAQPRIGNPKLPDHIPDSRKDIRPLPVPFSQLIRRP